MKPVATLVENEVALASDHTGAESVTRLRRCRYPVILLLLLYALIANGVVVVGWRCPFGPHPGQADNASAVPDHACGLDPYNSERSASGSNEPTFGEHCCACFGSPLLKRALNEHVGSYMYLSDANSLPVHQSSFIREPGAASARQVSSLGRSPCSGNSELAWLSTVVLLI